MKMMNFKSVLFACVILLVGFASCSSDDKEPGPGAGDPAFVRIQVKGTVSATSPVSIDGDQANVMNDLTVFIMGPTNEILGRKYMTGTEYTNGASVKIPTTTNAQHIFVVGNIGSDQTGAGGMFGSAVTNYSQLQTAYLELNNISKTALWIEGHTTSPLLFANTGGDLVATAVIQMHLIPSRIDIYINNNMTNYSPGGADNSMILNDVGVLNSGGWTSPVPNFVPASTIPSLAPYYRSGFDDYASFPTDEGIVSVLSSLLAEWDGNTISTFIPTDATPTEPTNFNDQFTYSFYALPSLDRTEIVSVRATLGNGSGLIYFPIHFDTADTGFMAFENGKRYIVTVNLNGDARTSGGGSVDPEIPITEAFVTVEVTPAEWDIKSLPSKDFN